MKLHELKIKEEYFNAVIRGEKTFELRKNDRDYEVGDLIHFKNIFNYDNPDLNEFEGYENCVFQITCVLKNVEQYGLDKEYCILGIKKLEIR